jgi:dTDP-4-amino-4,6-dideoxygalactose transaminase
MTTTSTNSPPIFQDTVQIVRPLLPPFDELSPQLRQILESGWVTKGRYLAEFEQIIARHLGVRHAIATSSCTTGLMLMYRCLGLEGEIIVPSFTFMATVSAAVWAGLRPVFADVNLHTHNLDSADVERAITPRTSAVIAAHIFGNPADVQALQDVAERHGLALLFDAAHGFGALYRGRPVGAQGVAQSFSLSPTKLLIAGEGGIVATNDDRLADKLRIGREYGNSGHYDSAFAGFNARMPEMNALLGIHSLEQLEGASRRRNEVAELYRRELGRLPGIGFQSVHEEDRCSYKDFSITVDQEVAGIGRDQVAAHLADARVDTRAYYDPPVHRQTAYRQFDTGRSLPHTDLLAARSLSLPIWSDMDDETALGICAVVEHAFAVEGRSSGQRSEKVASS